MRSTGFIGVIILSISLGLILTYGRWEYLSYRYHDEFVDAIHNAFTEGCVIGESPQIIKVMDYRLDHARVWMKGESQSTYLINFHKKGNNRSLRNTGSKNQIFCDMSIIHSTLGGGTDKRYRYR